MPSRFRKPPKKFREAGLPALYDDSHGTVVYQIPRIHPGLARRSVDSAAIGRLLPIRTGDDLDRLTSYSAAVENPGAIKSLNRLARIRRAGYSELPSKARRESILLQETWDPAWHAYDNGKELPVRVDPAMGFMLIDVAEGAHNIQYALRKRHSRNRFGQGLFVLTVLALSIFNIFPDFPRDIRIQPANDPFVPALPNGWSVVR